MAGGIQHSISMSHLGTSDLAIANAFINHVNREARTAVLVNKLPASYSVAAVLELLDSAGFTGWYSVQPLPSAFVIKYNVAVCLNFQSSSIAQSGADLLRSHSWPASKPTIIQTHATALQFHAANLRSSKAKAEKIRRRKLPSASSTSVASEDTSLVTPKSLDEISEVEADAPSPTSMRELSEMGAVGPPPLSIEEVASPEALAGQRPGDSRARAQSADSALLRDVSRRDLTVLICAGAGCRVVLRRATLEIEDEDVDARADLLQALRPRVRTEAEVLGDRVC